jgi:hypothetical protein
MIDYVPLLSGLIGALIGAGASIAAQFIQARFQSRRDRLKLITDMALADHKHTFEVAQKMGRPTLMYPLPVYVHYHAGLLALLEDNALTPEALRNLKEKNREIMDMMEETPPRM